MCLLFCFVCVCAELLWFYDTHFLRAILIQNYLISGHCKFKDYINNSGKSYLVLRKSWKSHVDRSGLSVRKPLLDGSLSKPAALFISWQQHRTTNMLLDERMSSTFWMHFLVESCNSCLDGGQSATTEQNPNGVVG